MEFSMHRDPLTLDKIYTLTISDADLTKATYLRLDSLLLAECEKSDSIADKLLALQTIAFRIEQSLESQAIKGEVAT